MRLHRSVLRKAGMLMVSGVLAACAVSCASFGSGDKDAVAELKAGIQETVSDSARAAKMLKTVDKIVASVEQLDKLIASQREQLNAQIKNYSTTRKALDASMASKLKARQAVIDKLAAAHYDFKSQATAKEWKKLCKQEKKAIAWVKNRSEGGA